MTWHEKAEELLTSKSAVEMLLSLENICDSAELARSQALEPSVSASLLLTVIRLNTNKLANSLFLLRDTDQENKTL